jgi:flagellar biosynthesis component FlhA
MLALLPGRTSCPRQTFTALVVLFTTWQLRQTVKARNQAEQKANDEVQARADAEQEKRRAQQSLARIAFERLKETLPTTIHQPRLPIWRGYCETIHRITSQPSGFCQR